MSIRRIAVISMHTCPLEQPGTGDSGGMNVYVMSLAHAMSRRGVQSDIFTRKAHPSSASVLIAAPGVRVFHVDAGDPIPLEKELLPLLVPAFVAEIGRIAEDCRGEYDAIHSHYWMSALAGRFFSRQWNIPHIMTFHSLAHAKNSALAPGETPESARRIVGEMRAAASADHIIASTQAEAALLEMHYGAHGNRLSVVPPGADNRLFSPGERGEARRRLALRRSSDEFVLVMAGRIQPLKGIDIAINAVDALQDDPRLKGRVRLVILGGPSGPHGECEMQTLEKLASGSRAQGSIEFHEPLPQKELVEYYRAADLVLVPSRSESFGLVALEAQAVGTPVVASNAGGLPEAVLDGETGIIVRDLAPASFARAIAQLLMDPAKRAALGENGIHHASHYTWGSTAKKILTIYRACHLIKESENCEDEEAARTCRRR